MTKIYFIFSSLLLLSHWIFTTTLVQADVLEEKTPYVLRAGFTSAIKAQEPIDNVTSLSPKMNKIFYFTELRNFQGQSVTHSWAKKGKEFLKIVFVVRSDQWKVFSSKENYAGMEGEWVVSVIKNTGEIMRQDKIFFPKVDTEKKQISSLPTDRIVSQPTTPTPVNIEPFSSSQYNLPSYENFRGLNNQQRFSTHPFWENIRH